MQRMPGHVSRTAACLLETGAFEKQAFFLCFLCMLSVISPAIMQQHTGCSQGSSEFAHGGLEPYRVDLYSSCSSISTKFEDMFSVTWFSSPTQFQLQVCQPLMSFPKSVDLSHLNTRFSKSVTPIQQFYFQPQRLMSPFRKGLRQLFRSTLGLTTVQCKQQLLMTFSQTS